jgi:C-terminal processing protease CtpA/Prc
MRVSIHSLVAALRRAHVGAAMVALALLASCGGGGGGGGSNETPQSCSANNPYRADATGPTITASLTVEKSWVRDYVDTNYLWYNEVPNVNAADPAFSVDTQAGFYSSIDNYFEALKTTSRTPSNKPTDQFSFTYPTRLWDQLINSGSTAGWGIEWHFDTFTNTSITGVKVAFVHLNSPAANADFRRGDALTSVGGLTASANTANEVNALLARLYPPSGVLYQFAFDRGGSTVSAPLTSTNVALTSIDHTVFTINGAKVGYLLFNDHVLTAERPMIDAFKDLAQQGVVDLVLDLRYNGGGYLFLASELAYMVTGPARANNKVFESTVFNNKQQNRNDATGFLTLGCIPDANFNCTTNEDLPTLGLPRVYVLTSANTCSASEAIINGLRGVDVDVRLIGSTTCGKPYGFFGQSNCGITYFPIEFKGVNNKGYGDYADGFVPSATGNTANLVTGCSASDDLTHALGDPTEGQLAAALYHRLNSTCPPQAMSRQAPLSAGRSAAAPAGVVVKPPVLTNRNARMPTR